MSRIVLLDRDGVINQDSFDYIKSADEFLLIPESIEAIARLSKAGYKIGIATNQSGVSRGLYTEDDLAVIHQKMIHAIHNAGGFINALVYCTHLPEQACSCRKPQPGMLYALAKQLACSLEGVPFVGDRISDIQAALAAGASPVLVLSPMTDRSALATYPDVPIFNSLAEFVALQLRCM